MKTIIKIAIFAVMVIAAAGLWYYKGYNGKGSVPVQTPEPQIQAPAQEEAQAPIAQAKYTCDGGKTIEAEFYKGKDIPVEAGQPPVPTGKVKITFSDGTSLELAQTISADGGRYANANESFIFWDKGETALVLENDIEINYKNCVAASAEND